MSIVTVRGQEIYYTDAQGDGPAALVIHAEADPIIPLVAGRGLNAALPGASELVVVPGAGVHAPVLTHPDTVIPAIRKFLRQ